MSNPILLEDLERIYVSLHKPERFKEAIIIVTGCAGFLGFYFMQFLVRYAKCLGIRKVIGLDNFLLGKPNWLSELANSFSSVFELHAFNIAKNDISNIKGAREANFIIHAASIASPTFYRQYPVETVDANVWGLRKLFDFYRGSAFLRGGLFFSSSEIYGDPDSDSVPTDEEYWGHVSCVGPRACYDEAKRFGETMCWIYAKEYGMPITVMRPFNNYGPGMHIDDKRLPADFAKCVLQQQDIIIFSDGTPTRTFCYVSDAISGYSLGLLYGKYDYFNIGIDKPELMVRDFAKIYQAAGAEIFNYTGVVRYEKSKDPDYMTCNPNRRCPIITKSREKLGFEPKVFVEEGVRRYLKFLKYEEQS